MKSSLVIEEENNKIDTTNKEESNNEKESITEKIKESVPSNYMPIHLASEGLLDAPKILHFRDYTLDDAMELNPIDDEEKLNAIVRTLNNMVWEDFDCNKLHMKELSQIIYTLHLNFINQKIEKEYYIDENLPEGNDEGQLDHESNIAIIEIPMEAIKVRNINKNSDGTKKQEKFREPFEVFDDVTHDKIGFRLTKVYDLIFAKEYCDNFFSEELKDYKPYKIKLLKETRNAKTSKEKEEIINRIIDEDYDSYLEYKKFNEKYNLLYGRITQASVIVSLNGVELKEIEEKINAYKDRVSLTMWPFYNQTVADYDFGIQENVTFFSEKLQKNITRRFLFQLDDFIPDTNKDYSRRYHLQFN